MTPEALNALAAPIRDAVTLADAYVRCAADQLAQGNYAHALALTRRAAEVCSAYRPLFETLNASEES